MGQVGNRFYGAPVLRMIGQITVVDGRTSNSLAYSFAIVADSDRSDEQDRTVSTRFIFLFSFVAHKFSRMLVCIFLFPTTCSSLSQIYILFFFSRQQFGTSWLVDILQFLASIARYSSIELYVLSIFSTLLLHFLLCLNFFDFTSTSRGAELFWTKTDGLRVHNWTISVYIYHNLITLCLSSSYDDENG